MKTPRIVNAIENIDDFNKEIIMTSDMFKGLYESNAFQIGLRVGEVVNYVIGISFCLPAAILYKKMKTKRGAVVGLAIGTIFMTVLGCFVNAYILLPTYAAAFKMPIDALVGMGTAVNANITSLFTFVMFAVAPFNLLKGVMDSIIVLAIYKKISPILK